MVKGEQRGLQIERLQAFFMFIPFITSWQFIDKYS